MFLKSEVLDDLPGAAGKTLDVVGQIGGDVVRVALELLEGVAAGVVERHSGDTAENGIDIFNLAARELLLLFKDLVFGGFQDAIKPPQDRQGQHDILILVRAVRSTNEIGNRPDEIGFFVKVIHPPTKQNRIRIFSVGSRDG